MSSTSEYENEWGETIVHWSLQDNPFFAQMPTVHIARAVRKLGEDEVTTPDTQCSRMFARVRNHRVDMNVMNGPDLLGQKGAIAQPHSYYDMLPFDNFIQTTGYTTMYAPDNWVPRSSSSYAKYRQLTKANISTDGYINAASRLVIGGEETLAFTEFALVQDEIKRTAAEVIYDNPELRHDPTIMVWINLVGGISYNDSQNRWEQVDKDTQVSDGLFYTMPYFQGSRFNSTTDACDFANQHFSETGSIPGVLTRRYVSEVCTATQWVGGQHWSTPSGDSGYKPADQTLNIISDVSDCPSGWYITAQGCVEFLEGTPLSKEDFVALMLTDDGVNVNNLPNLVYPAEWAIHDPFIPPVEFNLGMPRRNGAYDSTKPNSPSNKPFIQRKITATHDMSRGEVFGVMLSERDVLVDNAT